MESDHGKVSHAAVQNFLLAKGADRRAAKFLSAVLGGHHGRINRPEDPCFRPRRLISEQQSGIDWDKQRDDAARDICDMFGTDLNNFRVDQDSPALWWLAGLTSVADWIGSDERFFSPEGGAADGEAIAERAITAIGLVAPAVKAGLSFHDLFHDSQRPVIPFAPNDMQSRAVSTINAPGVYVIEAPMGTGKTEAALWAAYQLLMDKRARGIYFALPTQATSNRMHRRMAKFVGRMAPAASDSRLIHSNSWLLEQELGFSPAASGKQPAGDDARVGHDWFASAKRALLAPFGVGTVDQALLGVVAAKHFFVRRYALAGKVVILDEVHSYDIYTGTLIDKLICTLEELGCTVIVLSATLSGKRRNRIACSDGEGNSVTGLPYPVLTGRRGGVAFPPVPAAPPPSRNIEVAFQTSGDATKQAIAIAEDGGCVLWICNTVASSQEHYERLLALAGDRFPLGLLHSRFPFWRREELENEWMERLGKTGAIRCGSILVSTQIVEQSVDLDADLLVTELAPTDMLLQRTGRLWRHMRQRPASFLPRLIILEEIASLDDFRGMDATDIVEALGGKARVYAPYVLLRSLEIWKAHARIELPTQIRSLIESTYRELASEPDSWQRLFDEWFATDSCKKMHAARNSNIWQTALEDEEGVQTRLNELPTLSLVLCRNISKTDAELLDASRADFHDDEFRLATAQAIHRNVVKIPDHNFRSTKEHRKIGRYVRGPHRIGLVDTDGTVRAEGLETGIRLRWSCDLGIVIDHAPAQEEP